MEEETSATAFCGNFSAVGSALPVSAESPPASPAAWSEEEPAAEADGDAMDMTAVNKLTAHKLKKELKKRKLDDKGKKAELKARLVEALGL